MIFFQTALFQQGQHIPGLLRWVFLQSLQTGQYVWPPAAGQYHKFACNMRSGFSTEPVLRCSNAFSRAACISDSRQVAFFLNCRLQCCLPLLCHCHHVRSITSIQSAASGHYIVDPQAKTSQCCGNCRHRKCKAFQRCISPGFIIGWKNSKIKSNQQIIIRRIKNAIIAIQVGGNKDHLYLIFGTVIQSCLFDPVQDRIPFCIVQIMGKVF